MLTYTELEGLVRETRDQPILSVYLNGDGADSLSRSRWAADLRHSLDDIETWLKDATHAEREDFAARRRRLEERVARFQGEIGAAGWIAFLDASGMRHEARVPVPVPTMAIWSTGAGVAPYIRVLKESRPVIVAVVDSRHAQLYRYVGNKVERLDRFEADTDFQVAGHMSRPAQQGFHSGTRGTAGADAAQEALQRETDRVLAAAADRISAVAGTDGWVVIGGIPTVAAAAMAHLAPNVAARAMRAELDVHATEAQVAECARESASALRNAADAKRVRDAIGAAAAGGLGVTGSADTGRALAEGRARHLFFTLGYLENNAADLEGAVRTAFDHGTEIEHVSGEAAAALDDMGGIAASLRYVAQATPTVSRSGALTS